MPATNTGFRISRAEDRGVTDLGWLDSRHSFSFGGYRDPARAGFGVLRVLNDDTVAPGAGFGEHGHRDMEIISLVLEGALEHHDSEGNREILHPGDVQVMSAGRGIRHGEKNASSDEPVRFIQVWIEPDRAGHEPRHERIAARPAPGGWSEIASGNPIGGGLRINQNASITLADLADGASIVAEIPSGRAGYLHVAAGSVGFDGQRLAAGDAIELDAATTLTLSAIEPSTLLLFDLPGS